MMGEIIETKIHLKVWMCRKHCKIQVRNHFFKKCQIGKSSTGSALLCLKNQSAKTSKKFNLQKKLKRINNKKSISQLATLYKKLDKEKKKADKEAPEENKVIKKFKQKKLIKPKTDP